MCWLNSPSTVRVVSNDWWLTLSVQVTTWRQRARECILEVPILRSLLQQKQQEVERMVAEKLAVKSPLPTSRHGLCCKLFILFAMLALLAVLVFVVTFTTQPTLAPQLKYWLVRSGIYSTVRMAAKVEF